jgi:presenilin-like A22 family membrane protease
MKMEYKKIIAMGAILAIALIVQIGAVALIDPFLEEGYQSVEDPDDPLNGVLYLAVVLVATAILLYTVKREMDLLIRLAIISMCGFISWYAFTIISEWIVPGGPAGVIALILAGGLSVMLFAYPEWYVIDGAGIIVSASAAGLFGISFGPLPALILLTFLIVYDIISVYKTKHMLTLADEIGRLKLPLILIVPLSLGYSFFKDDIGAGKEGEREAFYIGLGDLILPTIMVASAACFSEAPYISSKIPINVPAVGSMVGTMGGLIILLWLVDKGRAHAGLPFLNGGAIIGYIVGSIIAGISLTSMIGL